MLGKEHIKATFFFMITAIIFILFSYLNPQTSALTFAHAINILILSVKNYWIYILLFAIGMMMSATVPDIDISTNIKGIKVWNKIIGFSYKVATLPLALIFGAKPFTHRHIYHSLFGAISYGITIAILSFLIVSISLFAITVFTTHSAVLSLTLIATNSFDLLMLYKYYLLVFIIGAFMGFMAHLFEDTITVSGINYLPGFLHKRIAGKFITTGKNGYKNAAGETIKVKTLSRSITGAYLLIAFNLIFDVLYFYFSLYLISFYLLLIIFYISLVLFEVVFCNLRIKKDYY